MEAVFVALGTLFIGMAIGMPWCWLFWQHARGPVGQAWTGTQKTCCSSPDGTQGSFLAQVGAANLQDALNVRGQVASHFCRTDVSKRCHRQTSDVRVLVVHVHFHRICYKHKNLLALVQ